MEYIIPLMIITPLVIIVIILSNKLKITQSQLNSKLDEYIQSQKQKIIDNCNLERSALQQLSQARQTEEAKLNERRASLKELSDELEQRRATMEEHAREISEKTCKYTYNEVLSEYQNQLQSTLNLLKSQANQEFLEHQEELQNLISKYEEELDVLCTSVGEWEAKHNAINQDILRQREIEEKQDFYRVVLSENAINDIAVLTEIRSRLSSHVNLDKLIYDGYVSKPVQEMVKRVLAGRAPCGIYKITRMRTGEIYIGQSTDVKNRWQEHCKSCFNVGTIAHSVLHTTMQRDGIENFTFELLEECDKDKLREREKFYIQLYNSKTYGLNEKN